MRQDRLSRVSEELEKNHQIDVVADILLGRPDRVYLYAEKAPLERMTLSVISGTLARIGFPDADAISIKDILADLDLDNCYAAVSGADSYRAYVDNELSRDNGEPNVTFPIRKDGKRYWLHILMHPIVKHPDVLSVFITDMTETMIAEELNFDRSHRDSLTGLFNKYTLDYHYGLRFRFPGFHAMYLDLDDFKSVNDQHGHVQGDAFLRSFADILKSHQRNDSLFYRLGGDEFIGMLFGTETEVRRIADDILARTREIRLPGVDRIPSVSIGIIRSDHGDDLIRKADKVMYDVKNSGKNDVIYTTETAFDAREIKL